MLQQHKKILTHLTEESSLPDVPWDILKVSSDFTNFSMFAIIYLNKIRQLCVVTILQWNTWIYNYMNFLNMKILQSQSGVEVILGTIFTC